MLGLFSLDCSLLHLLYTGRHPYKTSTVGPIPVSMISQSAHKTLPVIWAISRLRFHPLGLVHRLANVMASLCRLLILVSMSSSTSMATLISAGKSNAMAIARRRCLFHDTASGFRCVLHIGMTMAFQVGRANHSRSISIRSSNALVGRWVLNIRAGFSAMRTGVDCLQSRSGADSSSTSCFGASSGSSPA